MSTVQTLQVMTPYDTPANKHVASSVTRPITAFVCLSVGVLTDYINRTMAQDNRATQGMNRVQWKPSALCSPVPNRTPACSGKDSGAPLRVNAEAESTGGTRGWRLIYAKLRNLGRSDCSQGRFEGEGGGCFMFVSSGLVV
jgi:hypothetical protein